MKLAHERQGTATVEYLVVTLTVTAGAAAALSLLGPPLVAFFNARIAWLALPIP